MNIVWMILIGFVVGMLAKWIMPGEEGGGFIMTTVLGIAGSFVGGFLFQLVGIGGGAGFIGSVVGAIVILWVVKKLGK
jgi:uncharacterized membrane protein YeaQ/YmgE (transglycosylase-associated protein family)